MMIRAARHFFRSLLAVATALAAPVGAGCALVVQAPGLATVSADPSGRCDTACANRAIALCKSQRYDHEPVQRRGHLLCFSGAFDQKSVDGFWYGKIEDHDIIVARSRGGYASAGLIISQLLAGKKVTVVAWDYCDSACAIYLFVPAMWKRAANAYSLGFHGLRQPEWAEQEGEGAEVVAGLRQEKAETLALYRRIGVDPKIFTVPAADPGVPIDDANRLSIFWFYKQAELARFGVTGILGTMADTPTGLAAAMAARQKSSPAPAPGAGG